MSGIQWCRHTLALFFTPLHIVSQRSPVGLRSRGRGGNPIAVSDPWGATCPVLDRRLLRAKHEALGKGGWASRWGLVLLGHPGLWGWQYNAWKYLDDRHARSRCLCFQTGIFLRPLFPFLRPVCPNLTNAIELQGFQLQPYLWLLTSWPGQRQELPRLVEADAPGAHLGEQ